MASRGFELNAIGVYLSVFPDLKTILQTGNFCKIQKNHKFISAMSGKLLKNLKVLNLNF